MLMTFASGFRLLHLPVRVALAFRLRHADGAAGQVTTAITLHDSSLMQSTNKLEGLSLASMYWLCLYLRERPEYPLVYATH